MINFFSSYHAKTHTETHTCTHTPTHTHTHTGTCTHTHTHIQMHTSEYMPFRFTFYLIYTKMYKSIIYGKNKTKKLDMRWIPALFTKIGKYDMVMFRGCFHGYSPTCQLYIRPQMKEDVLSFQMIHDVSL